MSKNAVRARASSSRRRGAHVPRCSLLCCRSLTRRPRKLRAAGARSLRRTAAAFTARPPLGIRFTEPISGHLFAPARTQLSGRSFATPAAPWAASAQRKKLRRGTRQEARRSTRQPRPPPERARATLRRRRACLRRRRAGRRLCPRYVGGAFGRCLRLLRMRARDPLTPAIPAWPARRCLTLPPRCAAERRPKELRPVRRWRARTRALLPRVQGGCHAARAWTRRADSAPCCQDEVQRHEVQQHHRRAQETGARPGSTRCPRAR